MSDFVKSPLNYTGGKYKLLDKILVEFPKNIDKFVDIFAGGLNVGINVDAVEIYANDRINYLIDIFRLFQNESSDQIVKKINYIIDKYELSQTNTEGYNKLRSDYNESKNTLELFVLTCYSFNHQIRFNNSMLFNTPFGKDRSSFNSSIEKNLREFCDRLKQKNIILSNDDFRDFDYSKLNRGDVVYCDPPYLITNGSYNDGKRGFGDWLQEDDMELLELLDSLNSKGVIFFLSNVFYHKGLSNDRLIEWSRKYKVIYLDKNYANCNYHFKNKESKTVEVLITNYENERR